MRISANKKVWKTLLCLAAGLLCCCCMLCLAACDEDSGGKPAEHTHDWGEWTVVQEPTCTREGQRQRVCKSDSSHVETEAIAALGHDLVGVPEQPATCTEEGHTAYKQCSRCWYTEGYNILRPAGHSASENDWCRDDYFHWQICSVCGEQFNKDEHEYSHLCVCGLESDYTLGLHFKLLYDGTYEVSKGQATDTVLKIPAIYHGRDVSSVATAAFRMYDCTEVILPDTITTIGINAFQYCSLSKITLSNNLTEMGDYAFYYCDNLVSVDIPASLKEIPFHAFYRCIALSSVTLHEGLEVIGASAFGVCRSLSSVSIPTTVTEIGGGAFANSGLTSAVIPGNVVTLGAGAFSYCENLTYVKIAPGLKYLGGGAFGGCKLLTEMQQIELPDGILEIGGNPLNETPVYTNAADRAAKNKTLFTFSVNGYLFKMTDSYIEKDKRPESVSIVGNVVAGGAVGLTSVQSVTVSDSVTYIGERAFRDCYSLVSIKLSENITEIHDETFYNCFNLRSISIPEKVERIGYNAFRFCSDLMTVDMPNHPVLIEQGAFANTGFFENGDFLVDGVLYIDGHLVSGYQFKGEEYTVLPGTYSIAEYAFFAPTTDVFPMKKLTFPDSVGIIGQYAFSGCYALEDITLSQNVTYIGVNAFRGEKLKPFELPQTLEYIGTGNFNKEGFYSSRLPDKLTVIEDSSFAGSAFEGLLVLPENLERLETWAFRSCEIDEVIVPKGIESFDIGAFGYDVYFEDSSGFITQYPNYYYCGTEADWENVDIYRNESEYMPGIHGTIKLYFYSETAPTGEGRYWHYVDGKPAIWE